MMLAQNPTALGRARQRLRILAALVIRETSARFGRSWGGYIWAIAEPTGGIVLLSVAFSFITHVPPRGTSFMYFYASGFVPFMMYNSIVSVTMQAIRANKGLLTYPVVSPLDTIVARATLEAMSYFVVALIIFPAIAVYDGVRTEINAALLATAFGLAFALGLGVGTLNAVILGFFPTWQNIWGVLTRPLFIVSGILFDFDTLPTDLRDILWFNPVAHVIAEARYGLYGMERGDFVSLTYGFGIAMALFLTGAFLLRQNERHLLQQ